ncbi:MAG TPA: cupin domain-containing protein [Candidatus Tectomicrobia bacterium]|nr:cupin domain-containing protein [Candidatus Tectomicrobia bacterium]
MNVPAASTRDPALPAPYSAALEALSLAPLWTALHALLPPERRTSAAPHRWRWRDVRPRLLEAARLVPIEQAERRVLVLANPGLDGAYAVTSTLYAGLQIILPGEAAPSHRHTPAALRFVVEGRGAYTTVEGVRCAMEPGDLIITPPMRWHDHGHDGTEPVVWLDGLDIPLVRAFDASWASPMRPAAPPAVDTDPSSDEFTAAGVTPRRSRYPDTGYPQVRWPWRTVRPALERLAASHPSEPAVLRYVNPRTGGPPLLTMGAEAQWLRPGERTPRERRTASAVYHVIEGRGRTLVGDAWLDWEAGDTLVAPPWHWVAHENVDAGAPACLFRFDDEPAVRALGLWHEERA